jgi:hypothetical protein
MADHYLEFSEVLANLSPEEATWLRDQLKVVHVFDGKEYAEEEIPDRFRGTDAEWSGCRVFRDMKDYDPDFGDGPGFEHRFRDDDHDGGWGTHLWLFAIDSADLERVAHLVQRFLKRFRPGDCWFLTYATACSKPRVGEFGGGAVFVTASEIKWDNAHDFVDRSKRQFLSNSRSEPCDEEPCRPIP